MNDFCLGIAWFCFVEVKKFKNHFVFSCFFFNFSSKVEHVLNVFLFFGKSSLSVLIKSVLMKKACIYTTQTIETIQKQNTQNDVNRQSDCSTKRFLWKTLKGSGEFINTSVKKREVSSPTLPYPNPFIVQIHLILRSAH